jgi:thiosulfate/3-mercaptopyruvate sulfurtransferase
VTLLKSTEQLAKAYASLVPNKQTTVVIHCRTGHQASQTFFVMRYLLGFERVLWYDAGWSEWASRSELPVENDAQSSRKTVVLSLRGENG